MTISAHYRSHPFSKETERKFIEPWDELLFTADKQMLSRSAKVSIVTSKLNRYMQTELRLSTQYSEQEVNNKVDSTRKKSRELYLKFYKRSTGSAVNETDGDW
eukprot:scpid80363/ scgid23431/ 